MANFVSPGVYVVEKDISNYPTSVNPSVVGIVGFANQGPVNKATLITSQEGLVQMFGEPTEDIPGQGLEGALEILETTNSLYFVRGSGSTAADAETNVLLGLCPAVQVGAGNYGETDGNDLYLSVQVTVDGTNRFPSPKSFDIPAGTVATGYDQALAIKKIIGGSLDGADVASYYDPVENPTGPTGGIERGFIVAGLAGSGVKLSVSAFSAPTRAVGEELAALGAVNVNGMAPPTLSETVETQGWDIKATGTNSLSYKVKSLYPGVGYNEGIKSDGTTSGYSMEVNRTGGENVNVQVNRNGTVAESYKISLLSSPNFAEDVINTGTVDPISQYIKGYFQYEDADYNVTAMANFYNYLNDFIDQTVNMIHPTQEIAANARFVKPIHGTFPLAGGDNGTQDNADIIGDSVSKSGIFALDDDTLNISIGIVPGNSDENVQNNLVTLAQDSQNFLAVVSPPYGLNTVQQAIDWTNGQSTERTGALASNYAAVYWPWVQTYDTFSAKDRWYDPAIYAVRQMAYTDEVGDPWFAPAGVSRGALTKPTDVEISVNQGDRDSMYSGGNIINPIVNFPQQGIMIFGQRTAQRDPTALDRVNVRRLMIQVRKILLASTRRFVFEPNDSVTWEKIVGVVDPLMDDIRRRRGLVDYAVICDETTNTPIRVDRNELWCKVLMKPTKAAEVVVFELNLTNQAAQI